MVQQKLLFENGGHGPDRERNSRRGRVVQQVHPASTEPKATKATLLEEVVQAETLDQPRPLQPSDGMAPTRIDNLNRPVRTRMPGGVGGGGP